MILTNNVNGESMKTILTVILSVLVSTASFTTALADNRELAKEVMAIHDAAMAKMTHMHELKLQLQEIEKKSGKSAETTSALEALKSAHKGMMDWMHEYKAPATETEFQNGEDYLQKEKVKIQGVSDAINTSIKEAEELL